MDPQTAPKRIPWPGRVLSVFVTAALAIGGFILWIVGSVAASDCWKCTPELTHPFRAAALYGFGAALMVGATVAAAWALVGRVDVTRKVAVWAAAVWTVVFLGAGAWHFQSLLEGPAPAPGVEEQPAAAVPPERPHAPGDHKNDDHPSEHL